MLCKLPKICFVSRISQVHTCVSARRSPSFYIRVVWYSTVWAFSNVFTVFPVVMYGCESWTVKKAERRRIDAFELWCWRGLESPLDCKEIQTIHSEGDQPWDFFGRNDAEAETPVLWPPDVKSWLIGKDPDAGKDWGQEEKGTTEDEMVGWHHWVNGHGFG